MFMDRFPNYYLFTELTLTYLLKLPTLITYTYTHTPGPLPWAVIDLHTLAIRRPIGDSFTRNLPLRTGPPLPGR